MDCRDGNESRSFQVRVMSIPRADAYRKFVLSLSSSWREVCSHDIFPFFAKPRVKNVRVKNTSDVSRIGMEMI